VYNNPVEKPSLIQRISATLFSICYMMLVFKISCLQHYLEHNSMNCYGFDL